MYEGLGTIMKYEENHTSCTYSIILRANTVPNQGTAIQFNAFIERINFHPSPAHQPSPHRTISLPQRIPLKYLLFPVGRANKCHGSICHHRTCRTHCHRSNIPECVAPFLAWRQYAASGPSDPDKRARARAPVSYRVARAGRIFNLCKFNLP